MSKTILSISKTDYKYYLDCPEEAWMRLHQPQLVPRFTEDEVFILNQGNLVDAFVKELFADKEFIRQHKTAKRRVVFQHRVTATPPSVKKEEAQFLAVADVVVFDDEAGFCDIYEVKATKEPKEDHLHDLAFQRMVFELAGYTVRKTYLVHITPSYVFQGGTIDPHDYFRLPNVSEKVDRLMDFTQKSALEAVAFLSQIELSDKRFKLCSNKLDCFYLHHYFPNLPEYNILDIRRLGEKKRDELMAQGIFDIADVPTDFPLTAGQRQQVNIAQSGSIFIDKPAIQEIVKTWQPPFYFFDYETIGLVFPRDAKVAPYQQCVFQYSLHVVHPKNAQNTEGGKLGDRQQATGDSWDFEHREFVISNEKETMWDVLTQLKQDLKMDGGTVFVWNAAFEKTRNKEMAAIFPEFADFLNNVNDRMYDLEVPFKTGLYQHPKFKGKSSIKKVLPVLVPELNYAELNIQHGGLAYTRWYKMIFDKKLTDKERQQIRQDLLDYCRLDTWAMVRIWDILNSLN
jgi:Domain of unknown function(DUF2779)